MLKQNICFYLFISSQGVPNQEVRKNFNKIETTLIVKNRLLRKAELFDLPGF